MKKNFSIAKDDFEVLSTGEDYECGWRNIYDELSFDVQAEHVNYYDRPIHTSKRSFGSMRNKSHTRKANHQSSRRPRQLRFL